MIYSEEKT